MRQVALVGFADSTRDGVRDVDGDVEIWSLNWAYQYDFLPRIDRLFELHPPSEYELVKAEKVEKHLAFLRGAKSYPVYMQEAYPDIPRSIAYPLDAVSDDLFGTIEEPLLYRGDVRETYYTSSCSFMIALAIHERFDVIYTFGFEMGSTTEYRYQKPGAEFLLGLAVGRRIITRIPENSLLIKSKIYAYEGGQYVTVARMHDYLAEFEEQHKDAMIDLDRDTKAYMDAATTMRANGNAEAQAHLNETFFTFKESLLVAGIISGAVHAMRMYLNEERALSRQTLEHWQIDFDKHRAEAIAKLNVSEGEYNHVVVGFRKGERTQEELNAAFTVLKENLMNAGINAGAFQCTQKLIAELDLQEPDMTIVNPFYETQLSEAK